MASSLKIPYLSRREAPTGQEGKRQIRRKVCHLQEAASSQDYSKINIYRDAKEPRGHQKACRSSRHDKMGHDADEYHLHSPMKMVKTSSASQEDGRSRPRVLQAPTKEATQRRLSKAPSATQSMSNMLTITKMASLAPTRKHSTSQSKVKEGIQEDTGARDLIPRHRILLIKLARRQGLEDRHHHERNLGLRDWGLSLCARDVICSFEKSLSPRTKRTSLSLPGWRTLQQHEEPP